MAELLSMNGYGVYVWPCYAISLIVLGTLFLMRRKHLISRRHKVRAMISGND